MARYDVLMLESGALMLAFLASCIRVVDCESGKRYLIVFEQFCESCLIKGLFGRLFVWILYLVTACEGKALAFKHKLSDSLSYVLR